MRKQDRLLITTIIVTMITIIAILGWRIYHIHTLANTNSQTVTIAQKKVATKRASSKKASKKALAQKKAAQKAAAAKKKAALNLWKKPTGGTYPTLKKTNTYQLTVSLKKQRVYLDDKTTKKRLYTMVCSSGLNNTTPTGVYAVQERGQSFYNNRLNEGANYWVSWLNHGVYLFHTVPTDHSGNYNVTEAQKLGQPASHGCIRLSIPDAKWLHDNIPFGTKVVVNK
ncbi:L,D-transpeptidase [Lapidilactobacillus bayanensis]|uniref:L,D-transpeptidase n=1 Tax=Lapidilactobacillus bayanensis TaxID=2485998 RepID=UPI001CDBE65D|nr:L,D-transpeptidase [Lapidilactobacillus bayanensis]